MLQFQHVREIRSTLTEVLLDLAQPIGHDYWHLMNLAGRYAYAGREWVARMVVSILGGAELELVHNHHNFAWKETHGGEEVIVIRKGATPAFPGQKGFIAGSMGDDAVIVRGTTPDAATPAVREVEHVLTPLIVVMAGADEFDPYKD